jgi:hypothetical protein
MAGKNGGSSSKLVHDILITSQQVELHCGIFAACLPTLKPLFATFSNQIRTTFNNSRTTGSAFKSSGYVKHDDTYGHSSFAMKNLSEGSHSTPRNPYDEDVMLGKETYSVITNGGRKGRRQSRAGGSDESILEHDKRRSDGLARGMAIVKTTEVSVTR